MPCLVFYEPLKGEYISTCAYVQVHMIVKISRSVVGRIEDKQM